MREGSSAITVVVLVAWVVACSSGEEKPSDRASGASMQPPAYSQEMVFSDSTADGEPPRIRSVRFDPSSPMAGDNVKAQVDFSADDRNRVRFNFSWTVGGTRLTEHGSRIRLQRARRGDSIEVTVTARDNNGTSEPVEVSTSVRNRPPSIRQVAIEPYGEITAGKEITAHPTGAQDRDGDSIAFKYSWSVNGRIVDESSPVFATEGLRHGDRVRVEIIPSDNMAEGEMVESRQIVIANGAPVIVSEPGAASEDGVFRYRVRAEDPDNEPTLRFSLVSAPDGMTITSGFGAIEWKPRPDQGGTHVVEVLVEDPEGGRSSQRFEVVVGAGAETTEEEAPPASAPLDG